MLKLVLRAAGLSTVALAFLFLVNNYLNFWQDWPGVPVLFAQLEMFGLGPLRDPLQGGALVQSTVQFLSYLAVTALCCFVVWRSPERTLLSEADRYTKIAGYIVRGGFYAVVFIGVIDMLISFLRVEEILEPIVGEWLTAELGRSRFRGTYIYFPIVALSFIAALFTRTLGVHWLALFIVIAELQIVVARFIFSYEQAFMADLVRFWYGALFLFASAYTLLKEGHVRVDILYTGFTAIGKARTNFWGSLILGIPLCWIVLTRGMWDKTNVINGPILNFEVTQSGFGLYVKYFMAGFLVIYAVSMMSQFVSFCLSSAAVLLKEPVAGEEAGGSEAPLPAGH